MSDLKGKLIILDLWRTSCVPCIAALPMLSNLSEKYNEKLVVLPVTFEDQSVVSPVLKRISVANHSTIYSVTNDRAIYSFFPPPYNPYQVWINENGVIIAIGKDFNAKELQSYLKNQH